MEYLDFYRGDVFLFTQACRKITKRDFCGMRVIISRERSRVDLSLAEFWSRLEFNIILVTMRQRDNEIEIDVNIEDMKEIFQNSNKKALQRMFSEKWSVPFSLMKKIRDEWFSIIPTVRDTIIGNQLFLNTTSFTFDPFALKINHNGKKVVFSEEIYTSSPVDILSRILDEEGVIINLKREINEIIVAYKLLFKECASDESILPFRILRFVLLEHSLFLMRRIIPESKKDLKIPNFHF